MDSRTGKLIRMGRILQPESGRGIVVAASHGVLTGAPAGLRTRDEMLGVFSRLGDANGIMVAPGSVGMVESAFVGRNRPSLVVHVDWKSHGRKVFPPGEGRISEGTLASLATIDEVAAAGADAVMSYLYVGQDDNDLERREIERNARLAADCARTGIVLIIEPRAAADHRDESRLTPEVLAWYCRMSAEIGADIVKCVWPGSRDTYASVVGDTTVPVLLAGGAGGDESLAETMQLAEDSVLAGGAGLMFGRRIYSATDPSAVLRGLRMIVHEGATAKEGLAAARSAGASSR